MKKSKILMLLCLIFSVYQLSAMEEPIYPLHEAAAKGDLKKVETLVSGGADVNSTDNGGWTPLHKAAKNEQLEIVKFLIKNGASVWTKDKYNRTAYVVAFPPVIDFLKKYMEQAEALCTAADTGDIEKVKDLVEQKHADINAKNNNDFSPLHYAAMRGNLALAKYLIEHKAYVNILGGAFEATPLHYAAQYLHTDICGFLLNHDAKILIQDIHEKTAYKFMRSKDINTALYKKLFKSTILAKYEALDPQPECPICLEDFVPTSWIAVLTCGHAFHDQCIIKNAGINNLCPICKQNTNHEETKLLTEYKIRKPNKPSKPEAKEDVVIKDEKPKK